MVWGEQGFPSCSKAYGLPLYSAAWVKKVSGDERTVLLAGGGGHGQRGIPNALLLCKFNTGSFSLSDPPVCIWNVDVPHRIAVLPEENVAFCSFPNSCRWFEMGSVSTSADSWSTVIEDAGLQSALACHSDNCGKCLIATGGEDGHLRLFCWSNEGSRLIFDKTTAHTSVKDLVFSCDGLLLASLGTGGSCCVWSTESEDNNRLVANIPKENDEDFRFCRFSKSSDNDQVVYLTSEQGQGKRTMSRYNFIGQIQNGRIVSWQCQSSGKSVLKQTDCEDQISAFDISADGKMLAVGTIEGDIVILRSSNMSLLTVVKKAHSGLVTALAFNDSGGLLSTSVDTKARVTVIKENRRHGFSTFSLFMALLLLVALLVKHIRKDLSSLPSSVISLLNSVCDLSFNLGGQAASAAPDCEYMAT